MKQYDHVIGWALEHPWAVTPTHRRVIAQTLARRLAGQDVDPQILEAATAQRAALPQPKRGGGLAVLPLYGTLAPRINLLSDFSGGATFEGLEQQLAAAVSDPQVATIILDVNSPGGSVAGATEFARAVLKARAQKPIVAVANHLMASAAYWVAACCTEIVATPSAEVGSVGVYALYEDLSEALAELGIKRTVISAGKFKGEGVDEGPMSDDLRAYLQSRVDLHYRRFVADIAAGRGIKADVIIRTFGEGRTVAADDALAAGMVDRIGTLTDTIDRLRPRGTATVPAPNAHHELDDAARVTAQEPATVTAQERATQAQWRIALDRDLLDLDLHLLEGQTS